MKKKRKQSFSKKNQRNFKKLNQPNADSKLNLTTTTTTTIIKPSQSLLIQNTLKTSNCNLLSHTSLTRLDNDYADNDDDIFVLENKSCSLMKKSNSFLLKRDSIILNDCFKPQWMQTNSSNDFNCSFINNNININKKQVKSVNYHFNFDNYIFNLSNLSLNQKIIKNKLLKNNKKCIERVNIAAATTLKYSYVRNSKVLTNFKLIGLKFKFDLCKNWLLNSMNTELSHLCSNNYEFKTLILNFNHVNELETEINELLIINLINLNHEKSFVWFNLLRDLNILSKQEKIKSIKFETQITNQNNDINSSNTNNINDNSNKMSNKKPRPSYLIERDCHIFGGCVDDDALDEFFISSGAVYQSWPYVYEPGFQLVPLIKFEDTRFLLSRSDNHINYLINDSNTLSQPNQTNQYAATNTFDDELPSYSLDNFEINLFHVVNSNQKSKKHKSNKSRAKKEKNPKKKRLPQQPVYDENNELVYSSSLYSIDSSNYLNSSSYISDENDDVDDNDDSCSISSSLSASSDDSESFRAYKKRHEMGLNYNQYNLYMRSSIDDYTRARCCSQMSLNDLRDTNMTDSSSFENYLYNFNRTKNKNSHVSNKSKQRMTNSCKTNQTSGLNFKMKRFLSHRDFWNINEENNFRNHQQQRHIEYSDQLVYC